MKNQPLHDRIALVAGATRGAGRVIAIELGRAGATVYVTGRSTRAERSPMFMTAYYAAPFMIERKSGLIIEITDGVGYHYRGNLLSGQLISSWGLSDEYGFIDTDGRRPHWGRYAEEHGF
jgi:NAD(P)-dependent dehydrogenase (short-subunit alcohol dehydrogenase family)